MNLYTPKTAVVAQKGFELALAGEEAAVKELIYKSFNVGDCDDDGNSLLHYAVRGKNLNLIQFLTKQCGMDPAWANHQLVTPYDLAHSMGEEGAEIEKYFEEICGFAYEECYRNPVGRGMHADPSIVRVGDDYYMVNSSFVFFPCIPISHSKDLVHWEVIGHAVTDPVWAEEHLGHLEGGRGFWAPDISYHNGRFYICATLRNNDDAEFIQTQMVTSAERPEGPYETPVIHNVLGIDPSIFTDDDGRRYMLVNRGARIFEVSQDGKEVLSEPSLIWHGHSGRAPEGPHILKKDGYYYCFLAEGGTGKGHRITVGRSKELMGPYEDCPYNPIMTQEDAIAPIQCCGHGKPVQTPDGRWFIVYLCSRFLEDKWGMLGRETCLDEIVWTPDGWPIINRGKGPSYMAKLPFGKSVVGEHTGNNIGNDIGERIEKKITVWYTPRTLDANLLKIEKVTVVGCGRDLCDRNCRSLLVRNQPDFQFAFEMQMKVSDWSEGTDAGVTLYYDENTYIKFGMNMKEVFVSEYVDDKYVRTESVAVDWIATDSANETGKISEDQSECKLIGEMRFRVETDGLTRSFYYNDCLLATWDDVTSICSEGLVKGKRFTAATYGVYVNGQGCVEFVGC